MSADISDDELEERLCSLDNCTPDQAWEIYVGPLQPVAEVFDFNPLYQGAVDIRDDVVIYVDSLDLAADLDDDDRQKIVELLLAYIFDNALAERIKAGESGEMV